MPSQTANAGLLTARSPVAVSNQAVTPRMSAATTTSHVNGSVSSSHTELATVASHAAHDEPTQPVHPVAHTSSAATSNSNSVLSGNSNSSSGSVISSFSLMTELRSGYNSAALLILLLSIGLSVFVLPPVHITPSGLPMSLCIGDSYSPKHLASRTLQAASPLQVSALREVYRDKWLHFIGDSTLRGVYHELTSYASRRGILPHLTVEEQAQRNATRHSALNSRIGSSRISYQWAPFLANATDSWNAMMKAEVKPDLVIMSVGLHDLLYSTALSVEGELQRLANTLGSTHANADVHLLRKIPSLLFVTSPFIVDEALSGHRASSKQFRASNVKEQNLLLSTRLASTLHSPNFGVADSFALTENREREDHDDGLHSRSASAAGALALAAVSTCHLGLAPLHLSPAQLSLVLLAITLLAIVFYAWFLHSLSFSALSSHSMLSFLFVGTKGSAKHVYVSLPSIADMENGPRTVTDKDHPDRVNSGVNGTSLPNIAQSESNSTTAEPASWGKWLGLEQLLGKEFCQVVLALLQMLAILLFVAVVDGDFRLTWRLIGDKLYVRDTFIFIVLCLFFASLWSWSSGHDRTATILNRDQTEEWKGWMQLLFVLYHYFAAKEMYNLIRVFIAAYVFMTGYGNFLFFAKQADFSLVRLSKMLFRLNFFVFCICMALEREYMQYYVCALHTSFFLFVFVFMRLAAQYNQNQLVMATKFILGFLVLALVFDTPSLGLFNAMFAPFSIFYWKSSLHEWRFRSTLDHFATIIGMLLAWQITRLDAFYHWLERQDRPRTKWLLNAVFIGLVLLPLAYWALYLLPNSKSVYNAQNPYSSCIPILCFIFLRNWTSYLRTHHLALFAWFGKITLETYILQFHVWLADDAATLVFYTGNYSYPLLNFLIATAIYLYLAQCVFHITTTISDSLIPAKGSNHTVFTRTLCTCSLIAGAYAFSHIVLLLW